MVKRKRLARIFFCALLGLLALCPILPSPAAAQERQPYWQETFDYGPQPGWDFNWRQDGFGGWDVQKGQLVGHGRQWVTYRPEAWGNMGITYRFTIVSMTDNDNLHFNFQVDGPNRCFLQLTYNGCSPGEEFCDVLYLSLFQDAGNYPEPMSDVVQRFVTFPLRVSVSTDIGWMSVSLNDEYVLGASGNKLPPGNLGFETNFAEQVVIDDIQVFGTYFIEGNVYAGAVGNFNAPLPGMIVSLNGSNFPFPEAGQRLAVQETGKNGEFSFLVSQQWPYYHIIQDTPPQAQSMGAVSKDGIVRASQWIELSDFPGYMAYVSHENQFWVDFPTPTPTQPVSRPRVHTPTYTPTKIVLHIPTEPHRAPVDAGLLGAVAIGIAGLAVGAALAAGIVRLARRGRGQAGQDEPPRKPRPGTPPLLPLVRTARLWLTDPVKKTVWPDTKPLKVGKSYVLHLQIRAWLKEGQSSDTPGQDTANRLEVIFFAPSSDFRIERRRDALFIDRKGASTEAVQTITPLRKGRLRLRVGIYDNNVLLQSAILEAQVGHRGGKFKISRLLDYVADPILETSPAGTAPSLNIFTNQASDGTHWIGVFAEQKEAGSLLNAGDLHTFAPAQMAQLAAWARERLVNIQGVREYLFGFPLPLKEQSLESMERGLAALAEAGYRLYDSLFLSGEDHLRMERMEALHAALQRPGLISIARCTADSTTFPWAALYNLPLLVDRPADLRLCPLFKAQLAANRWSPEGRLIEKHDLLDQPEACRAQPECPLKGEGRLQTVCPFGFWGLLHQIEQPLQQITPVPVDKYPRQAANADLVQSNQLVREGQEAVRIVLGLYPGWEESTEHAREVQELADNLAVTCETDADRALALLRQSDHHIIYFFCHGRVEGEVFKLQLGGKPGTVSSAALIPFEMRWGKHPLVFLNGCATLQVKPELIHGFLGKLRRLGASAVIGTEVPVWTNLARAFGALALSNLLGGRSIGEAFLLTRRELQRQGNPLGLIYACFSPADLHLHTPQGCTWCNTHMKQEGETHA